VGAYIKDDTLRFDLSVTAWAEKMSERISEASTASVPCQLGKLLSEHKHTDVALRPASEEADGCLLHAHRCVLAARSEVFDRMFFGEGMKEAMLGAEVNMSDVDERVARIFLHALYTDEIQTEAWDNEELLCHLFASFHKYQVKGGLLQRCEARVLAQLSIDNVAERLMMADLLDAPLLRDATLGFIANGPQRLAEVQATDGFQRLTKQRPFILAEILAKAAPPAKRARSSDAEVLPDNLDDLRITELKQLLSDRGLPTSGVKAALIDRLRAHTRGIPD